MLGTDLRQKILYHFIILVGTFLAPFIAGALQRYIINPVVAAVVYVVKNTARFLWQAIVFAILSSLLINSLPKVAHLTLDVFERYALYDTWLIRWTLELVQRAAQQAIVSWLLGCFAGLAESLAEILKMPGSGGTFIVTQLNETWSKFVN